MRKLEPQFVAVARAEPRERTGRGKSLYTSFKIAVLVMDWSVWVGGCIVYVMGCMDGNGDREGRKWW